MIMSNIVCLTGAPLAAGTGDFLSTETMVLFVCSTDILLAMPPCLREVPLGGSGKKGRYRCNLLLLPLQRFTFCAKHDDVER